MHRRQSAFKNVNYTPLKDIHRTSLNSTYDDSFIDEQFLQEKRRIPIKSVCLAFFLFTCGLTLLIAGILQIFGYVDEKYADRTWPLLIMGSLMFLPGSYYVRIAYCAFYSYPGFTFDDIPEFD